MKKYHIITIGCQMNKSDSERIANYMETFGYLEADRSQADFIFINTCGIRQSAEDRIYGLIPSIKKENKKGKIILTGCLSQRSDVIRRLKERVDFWMPITDLKNLTKILNNKKGATYATCDYLKIKPKLKSKHTVFIPIGNGCNNFCSYCVVPYARGRESYREADDIIKEVRGFIKNGFKEIIFIAQNVNSYRSPKNLKYDFADLLAETDNIKGDFWIRFSTSHPKDMSDKLIKTIGRLEKICPQIHLPVQSGDDKILEKMNRKYTIKHFKSLIKKIRSAKVGVSLTSDVIVGFPGETKEQFNNTAKLFREIKFDMAYISQYSPRPQTKAWQLEDDVSKKEKKRREDLLTDILRKTSYTNNKAYISKEIKILLEKKDKNGFWQGRSETGKSVKFNSDHNLNSKLGNFIKVKITGCNDFSFTGKYE